MHVSDLQGKVLDYWVAQVKGIHTHPHPNRLNDRLIIKNESTQYGFYPYEPTRSWRQAGPIIEREQISLHRIGDHWEAIKHCEGRLIRFSEKSPLVAAMRCFVASKLGEVLPDENAVAQH